MEGALGPDHPNVGTVRYYMGEVELQLGHTGRSEAAFPRTGLAYTPATDRWTTFAGAPIGVAPFHLLM